MSRRGIVLRTPRTRYKRSNRDDTLDQAALQFDLDVSTFSKEEKVAVLNSVRNLYAGRNQVTAIAEASLRLLSTAFGVLLTEDDDDDSIRDKISPRFFSADQINGLVLSRVRDSSLELLRDWASTLGLPIAEDMAAPAASISSAIIAAREAPESPKRYSIDTLAPLSTEDLRKRRRLLGDGLVGADLLRSQLQIFWVNKSQPFSLFHFFKQEKSSRFRVCKLLRMKLLRCYLCEASQFRTLPLVRTLMCRWMAYLLIILVFWRNYIVPFSSRFL